MSFAYNIYQSWLEEDVLPVNRLFDYLLPLQS